MGSNSWTCKNLELKKNVSVVLKSQAHNTADVPSSLRGGEGPTNFLNGENINCCWDLSSPERWDCDFPCTSHFLPRSWMPENYLSGLVSIFLPQFSLDWWAQGYMIVPLLAILLPTARANPVPCLSLSSALERQSGSPWDVGDKWPQGTPKHWNSSSSKVMNLSMLGFFAPCFHCQAGELGFTAKSCVRSHCRVTKPL